MNKIDMEEWHHTDIGSSVLAKHIFDNGYAFYSQDSPRMISENVCSNGHWAFDSSRVGYKAGHCWCFVYKTIECKNIYQAAAIYTEGFIRNLGADGFPSFKNGIAAKKWAQAKAMEIGNE